MANHIGSRYVKEIARSNDDKKLTLVLILVTTGIQIRLRTGILYSYFSTNTYVVGTQKNRLNQTVLLNTHNRCYN